MHRVRGDEAYLLGWHNRQFVMISLKERVKLFAKVSSWYYQLDTLANDPEKNSYYH